MFSFKAFFQGNVFSIIQGFIVFLLFSQMQLWTFVNIVANEEINHNESFYSLATMFSTLIIMLSIIEIFYIFAGSFWILEAVDLLQVEKG